VGNFKISIFNLGPKAIPRKHERQRLLIRLCIFGNFINNLNKPKLRGSKGYPIKVILRHDFRPKNRFNRIFG
jgi:hypothetical protein